MTTDGQDLSLSDLRFFLREPDEVVVMGRFWDLQETQKKVTAQTIADSLNIHALDVSRVNEILQHLAAEGFICEANDGTYSCIWRRGQWVMSHQNVQRVKWPKSELVEKTAENFAASLLTGEGFYVLKPYYDIEGGDLYLFHRSANAKAQGIFGRVQAKGRTGEKQLQVDIPPEYFDTPLFFVFIYWLNRDQFFILSKADWDELCRKPRQKTLTITSEKAATLKLKKLGDLKERVRMIQKTMSDEAVRSPLSWLWDKPGAGAGGGV